MRRFLIAAAMMAAALTWVTFGSQPSAAQGQLPEPPKGFQPPPPPPPAPVKPYNVVAVTPPGQFNDPSFIAFRKNLAAIAEHKDRAALAKLVSNDFFWVQDKDLADSSKPGIDNLAKAIDLDSANGGGWDIVADAAADPTAAELPEQKGLFCAPAPPTFDPKAIQALLEQTQTDPTEWGYPSSNGLEARAAAQADAPVVEKLGMYLVRVLADSPPPNPSGVSFLHIALPDGKSGFVPNSAIVPLATDQICYGKDAAGWKIIGYIGGVQQQAQ